MPSPSLAPFTSLAVMVNVQSPGSSSKGTVVNSESIVLSCTIVEGPVPLRCSVVPAGKSVSSNTRSILTRPSSTTISEQLLTKSSTSETKTKSAEYLLFFILSLFLKHVLKSNGTVVHHCNK